MNLVVQKYGGTSVGSIKKIERVADHIAKTIGEGSSLVVTVSAMGSHTDELMKMALEVNATPPRRELDMLLTAGERVSMTLLSIALDKRKIPSVSFTGSQCGILTDETHGNARIHKILGDRIREGLADNKVVIAAGFQGVSPKTKEVTTLGRGGTDLSAVALAASLGAHSCQIYTDVDGVFSADPRLVKGAKVIKEISWETMCELAWCGASVMHPRGAHVASKFDIPFEIRSSFKPEIPATVIKGRANMENLQIKAVTQKEEMTLLRLKTTEKTASILTAGLTWLWKEGETPLINHQTSSEETTLITQVISSSLTDKYTEMLKSASKALTIEEKQAVACVTVVGEGFWQSPETLETVLNTLKQKPVLVDTRNTGITICVEKASLNQVVNDLHQQLIEKP